MYALSTFYCKYNQLVYQSKVNFKEFTIHRFQRQRKKTHKELIIFSYANCDKFTKSKLIRSHQTSFHQMINHKFFHLIFG